MQFEGRKTGLEKEKKKSIWNWFSQQHWWFKSHLGPHAILILEVLRAQHGSNLAAEFAFSLKQSSTGKAQPEFNLNRLQPSQKTMLKYELEMNVFSVWED